MFSAMGKCKIKCAFSKYITGSIKRISHTNMYRGVDHMNLNDSRRICRELGYSMWSSSKRSVLLSVIVIDISTRIIQRTMKSWIQNHKNICPISFTPMSQIHPSNRYFHTNTWFDKIQLSEFIESTCDFVHPVTRVEFTEQDVKQIDPELLTLFNSRLSIRGSMRIDMENIQSIENEMEDFFSEIVETAYTTEDFKEFKIVAKHWNDQLAECFWDLLHIDTDRCRLAIKSLYDRIPTGPYSYVYMSYNRKRIMQMMIQEYIKQTEFIEIEPGEIQ